MHLHGCNARPLTLHIATDRLWQPARLLLLLCPCRCSPLPCRRLGRGHCQRLLGWRHPGFLGHRGLHSQQWHGFWCRLQCRRASLWHDGLQCRRASLGAQLSLSLWGQSTLVVICEQLRGAVLQDKGTCGTRLAAHTAAGSTSALVGAALVGAVAGTAT